MTLQTLSTLADVLMRDYDPVIRDQRNDEAVLVDKIQANVGVQPMANNSFYIKARAYGHGGWYTDDGAAGADLSSGEVTYDEMTVPACYSYGTHQITDSSLVAAGGKPGAIVDVAADFAQGVKDSLRKEKNRMWLGRGGTDADNAIIAVVNGAVSGTTVILEYKDPAGVGTCTSGAPGLGTLHLQPGNILAVGTDAELGSTTSVNAIVSTVDSITNFTSTASVTLVDGDNVIRGTGASTANADDLEMNGFHNVVSASNTFQNVARSTNFWAQAYLDETAEALDETDMISCYLETKRRGGKPNIVLLGGAMFNKYASLLTSLKKSKDLKETLLGGFTGLEFAAGGAGIVCVLDWDVWYGDVWFPSLDPKFITVCELGSGWLGADQGLPMFQKTNVRSSYWATYKFYGNLGLRVPASVGGLNKKTV